MPSRRAPRRLSGAKTLCRCHRLPREGRAPRPGVDVRQVPLPIHTCDDVADAAPAVEPAVKQAQFGLGRRHKREADGGAEEAGAGARHGPSVILSPGYPPKPLRPADEVRVLIVLGTCSRPAHSQRARSVHRVLRRPAPRRARLDHRLITPGP